MVKKYIITQDQVQQNFDNPISELPVSVVGVKTELDKKLDNTQDVSLAGKYARVGTDGKIVFDAVAGAAQSDWNETDTSADSFIKNKPFKTIGAGLTVSNDIITADSRLHFEVVSALPETGDTQTIYLLAHASPGTQNIYDEYIWVNVGTETEPQYQYEMIGTTEFQLNIVQNAGGITINDTSLQNSSGSQNGLLSSADWNTFNNKQNAVGGTDGYIVTYTATAGTLGQLGIDTLPVAGSTNVITSGAVYTALASKVDLVEGMVSLGKDSVGYYFNE